MAESQQSDSRKLLVKLRETLAAASEGQERLDRITTLIAESLGVEVCSIYLFRDSETLELCATEGLNPEAVHQTRLRIGEGLVGRVAKSGAPVNTKMPRPRRAFAICRKPGKRFIPASLVRRSSGWGKTSAYW